MYVDIFEQFQSSWFMNEWMNNCLTTPIHSFVRLEQLRSRWKRWESHVTVKTETSDTERKRSRTNNALSILTLDSDTVIVL